MIKDSVWVDEIGNGMLSLGMPVWSSGKDEFLLSATHTYTMEKYKFTLVPLEPGQYELKKTKKYTSQGRSEHAPLRFLSCRQFFANFFDGCFFGGFWLRNFDGLGNLSWSGVHGGNGSTFTPGGGELQGW